MNLKSEIRDLRSPLKLPLLAALVLLSPLLSGCPLAYPRTHLPLESLLADYNVNAGKVPKLWARARLEIKGPVAYGSVSSLATPTALLMLDKSAAAPGVPGQPNFLLLVREIKEVMRLGVDAPSGLYYFWVAPGDRGQAWYGRQQYAGAPGVKAVPIDPAQLVEILSVTEIAPPGGGALPAIVMTCQAEPFAYVVRYVRPQAVTGLPKVWREVYFTWSDNAPPRPFRVRLFDADGLPRVTAELSNYQPVEVAAGVPPLMPTEFTLVWPKIEGVQTACELKLSLSEMSTTHEFSGKAFEFWPHLPSGQCELTQVDASYGPVGREAVKP